MVPDSFRHPGIISEARLSSASDPAVPACEPSRLHIGAVYCLQYRALIGEANADTYGILPLPKWDEEQEEYRTHIYDQYSTFNIPKTVNPDRYEFIGIMMEALCAESFKKVYPAYYDVALKNKYASDANAAAMIDLIRNGAGMDLTFMFSDSFMRVSFMFRDLINNKNTDIASQYKKIEKSMLKTIERNIGKAYAD